MKRLIFVLATVFLASVVYAGPTHFEHGISIATPEQELASTSTVVSDGDLFVYDDAEIEGNLRVDGNFTLTGTFAATEPFISKMDTWDNLPAKSSVAVIASEVYIATATLAGDIKTINLASFTQPAFAPRSIRLQFDGGTSSSATVVLRGKNARGKDITESGIISSEIFESLNAWAYISTMTITVTVGGDATLDLAIGNGDRIGFLGDLGAGGDYYKGVVQTSTTKADETTSFSVDTTYDVWTHSDVPDGADDYYVFYQVRGK